MKIGFDAKRFFHNDTGLGFYSRTLIENIALYAPETEISLFNSTNSIHELTQPILSNSSIRFEKLNKPAWYYRFFNLNRIIKKSAIDIYHGLSNELPFVKTRIPSVVTIHDILYEKFPEDFPWIDRMVYHQKTKQAIANSDSIIAISEATKKDLIDRFKIHDEKVKVIYQPCDPALLTIDPAETEKTIKKYNLPSEFNYFVGSLTYRKNAKVILEAMSLLPLEKRLPLILAGSGKKYELELKKIAASRKLSSSIHFLQIPRKDVISLYHRANCLIYPSLGEGFGLPVLEGISANIPVITSKISSLPEAGGEVSLFIDPQSPRSLAEILMDLDKNKWIEQNREKRIMHLSRFEPSKLIKEYFDQVYKPLMK